MPLTKSEAKRMASSHKQRAKSKYGLHEHFSGAEWYALCEKHAFRCVMCGVTPEKLSPDHMIPLVKGGSNKIDNIAPVCLTCNLSKGTRITVWPQPPKVRRPRAKRIYKKHIPVAQPKPKYNPLDTIGLTFFGIWAVWPLLLLGMSVLGFDDQTLMMVGLLWTKWLYLAVWCMEDHDKRQATP